MPRLPSVLLCLSLTAGVALAQVPDAGIDAPKAKAEPPRAKAEVGIDVVAIDSGKTLYARNDAGLFNPASNVKLFTTAAALAILGPEYRWKTVVYADAPVSGGELKGRLYLKGHGDPTLVV